MFIVFGCVLFFTFLLFSFFFTFFIITGGGELSIHSSNTCSCSHYEVFIYTLFLFGKYYISDVNDTKALCTFILYVQGHKMLVLYLLLSRAYS